MIHVAIADDHHLVRQGIRALLESADDIQVVGEAADGLEAVNLARNFNPDVLVMDIFMPNLNGTQALERLRSMQLKTRIVMLSMYKDETLIRQTMRAGAKGYLLKSSVVEELLLAVRAAARGEIYLSPAVSTILMEHGFERAGDLPHEGGIEQLTLREREVLKLIAEGNTNRSVGDILHISEKTVEKHRSNLMKKIGSRDLAGLIRFAIKHGLIPMSD